MLLPLNILKKKKVELLVLEVGLGGRLDATTAHPYRPVIAVASIGLDHCEHLGYSLENIAIEKSSVITPFSSVISAKQDPVVEKILEAKAQEKQAKLHWVKPISTDWELGLAGSIQRENAAVAKGVLEALVPLGWKINETEIREGFRQAKWPGRLQSVRWNGHPLLIDGAHNPPAAKQLSKERNLWKHQKNGVHWILGIQSQKEGPKMLKHLLLIVHL